MLARAQTQSNFLSTEVQADSRYFAEQLRVRHPFFSFHYYKNPGQQPSPPSIAPAGRQVPATLPEAG
jgi:hypothetical protein